MEFWNTKDTTDNDTATNTNGTTSVCENTYVYRGMRPTSITQFLDRRVPTPISRTGYWRIIPVTDTDRGLERVVFLHHEWDSSWADMCYPTTRGDLCGAYMLNFVFTLQLPNDIDATDSSLRIRDVVTSISWQNVGGKVVDDEPEYEKLVDDADHFYDTHTRNAVNEALYDNISKARNAMRAQFETLHPRTVKFDREDLGGLLEPADTHSYG